MGNTEKFLQILIILSLSQRLFAVDINTATVSELANELSGIGAIKAQRIVEYREKIGGFVYPEQLMEIYGIGPKLLERNLDKIEISQPDKLPNSSQPASREKPLIKDEQAVFRDNQKENLPPDLNTLQSQTPLPASKEASLPKKKVPGTNNTNLDLSPEFEKPARPVHNRLWDILIVVPLFILCLFIFILAWLKQGIKDKQVQRKHWVSTTFVCSGCGQTEEFENEYEGHFRVKHIDAHLPPGWLCVPNWQNQLCDYCVECSKTFNRCQ
ncbi:MAG: hypothetical protein DRR16_27930 [Candidatus Parabeggiatoa sp. nov. 3]|nr:MAG: hypothetical protein DRR00_26445 [Gammaproteobacteria bacterium]RKZ69654.1 MAG: hypothetical protein DRQ99_00220 [Gammaproteobacteria bacterium]RKZ78312.1 MAG: hypothetical protein DRR16_27930 [Gammaproteobacteria bacterium]